MLLNVTVVSSFSLFTIVFYSVIMPQFIHLLLMDFCDFFVWGYYKQHFHKHLLYLSSGIFKCLFLTSFYLWNQLSSSCCEIENYLHKEGRERLEEISVSPSVV